jgi:hypothetical protein
MVLGQLETKRATNDNRNYKKYGWKNVAVKIKENDLIVMNRQLGRLGYKTLGDLNQLASNRSKYSPIRRPL